MKPYPIPGFTGINNRAPLDRLPKNEAGFSAVRDALNVDLTQAGTFQTRRGYGETLARENCRSGFTVDDTGSLLAAGDELCRFYDGALTAIDSLSSSISRVGYVKTPLGVVWSDGFKTRIVKNWVSERVIPHEPNPIPYVVTGAGGSLIAGTYGVSFAAEAPDGRRSPMTYPISVDVPENGSITISIAAQANAIQVFVTAANGSVFYRQGKASSGDFNVALHNAGGEAVVYEVEAEIPPARILGFRNGRIFSAVGPIVYYTQPWSMISRPGSDFIPLESDVRLIACVDAGVFIATTNKTWFLSGEPQQATMREIAPYGAVEGTLTELPNSTDLMWFTPRGQLSASQDGSFRLLQDTQIQFPKAPVGASVFMETNGMRQHITTLAEPMPSGSAVARSFMEFIES